ncbi:MAG TPA: hypothetical protein VMZ52_03185, partial [Bryobacteraceae bacterium]|nr:hypothetical protein [Bryobacteraceae bacterium]
MDELIRNPTTAKTGSDPIEAEPRHGSHSSGHEENDVSVPGLAKALGALIAGCIVVWLGLLGMWHYLTTHVEYEPVSPFTGMREMPSGPRLQVTPAPALQQYFDEEAQRLHSYGPTAEGSL